MCGQRILRQHASNPRGTRYLRRGTAGRSAPEHHVLSSYHSGLASSCRASSMAGSGGDDGGGNARKRRPSIRRPTSRSSGTVESDDPSGVVRSRPAARPTPARRRAAVATAAAVRRAPSKSSNDEPRRTVLEADIGEARRQSPLRAVAIRPRRRRRRRPSPEAPRPEAARGRTFEMYAQDAVAPYVTLNSWPLGRGRRRAVVPDERAWRRRRVEIRRASPSSGTSTCRARFGLRTWSATRSTSSPSKWILLELW